MKDLIDSLIRTYVPWLAGVIIGWLVSAGIPLDPEVEVQVTLALMGAASAIYYLAARILETHVAPRLGWLLGLARTPEYDRRTLTEREVDEQAELSREALRHDLR